MKKIIYLFLIIGMMQSCEETDLPGPIKESQKNIQMRYLRDSLEMELYKKQLKD